MIENINPTDKLVFELTMPQIDNDNEKKETLRAEIAEKYGVPLRNVTVNFIPLTVGKDGKKISLADDIINNIQDPQFFLSLCQDYIEAKNIKDVDFEDIKKINEEVEQYIDFNLYSKHKKYRFKYVKWSNYLSYGPDNYFDFTKLHGLVLLNSQPGNQGGKTTFAINLLRFALFGKSPKSPNLNSVFNKFLPEVTDVTVEVGIEIDGEDYVIKRTVSRPTLKKRTEKSKAKQTIQYYKVVGDGNYEMIENCEDESTQQTNNIIRETIGNPEDFDLVISATKKTVDDLFEKGKTEQGRLFSRWLGLVTIEQRETIAKDLWKKNVNPPMLSNKYNRGMLEGEITDFETCNKENSENIEAAEKRKVEVEKEIEKLNEQKIDTLRDRKDIKKELAEKDIATIENSIHQENDLLSQKRGYFKTKKEEYAAVKDVVFDEDLYNAKRQEIENKTEEQHKLEIRRSEIVVEYKNCQKEINEIKELLEQKICPTCKQPIDTALQNQNMEQKELRLNNLQTKGEKTRREIDKIKDAVAALKNEVSIMEENRKKVNLCGVLKSTLESIHSNIEAIKLKIADLERQKKEIEENYDNIKYNNEIDNRIRLFDDSIRTQQKIKDDLIREIQDYRNNIKTNENDIEERKKIIKTLIEEEKIKRNWEVYQQLVGKDGVVKIVLKRALPIINNEIKRILDGLCDFDIVLDVNDKNEIDIMMRCDGSDMPIGVSGSGFETTFAGIAVRSALATIGSQTNSSYLTLDEIDSTVNQENTDVLYELYNRLLNNYDFIFHIVHDDSVVDKHDMVVTVVKDGHVSRIEM